MKLLQVLAVLAGTALFFVIHAKNQPELHRWALSPTDRATHAQITLERKLGRRTVTMSAPIDWASLKGITPRQAAKLNVPAKFEIARDAGTLLCDGSFHWGRGSGSFEFKPNPQYRAELEKLGFELSASDSQEFEHFMTDLPLDFARAVHEAGLQASTQQLVEMRMHGVDKAYLRKLKDAGFDHLNAGQIIQLKIHGVD